MSKIILDLCGGTGAWSKPYKDAGYDVRVITSPDYDVCTYVPPKDVYGILAAPPCTMFSIARNDTTAKAPRNLQEGMRIVRACLEIIWTCRYYPAQRSENSLKFWALENPYSGYLKDFLGKPALVFQPYMYGDPYTKKTALWGMFTEPKTHPVTPERLGRTGKTFVKEAVQYFALKEHQIPEGYLKKTGLDKRTVIRSITPEKFAHAFFEANR